MYAEALNELTPGNSYEVTNWQGETMVVSRNTEEMINQSQEFVFVPECQIMNRKYITTKHYSAKN